MARRPGSNPKVVDKINGITFMCRISLLSFPLAVLNAHSLKSRLVVEGFLLGSLVNEYTDKSTELRSGGTGFK